MGYRSEVAVRCQSNAYKAFKKAYEHVGEYPDKVLRNDNDYLIYFDYIKWYEDYDIVHKFNEVMARLDDMFDRNPDDIYKNKFGYKFMRLGSDENDNESRTNCYHVELWMTRKIDLSDFVKNDDLPLCFFNLAEQ